MDKKVIHSVFEQVARQQPLKTAIVAGEQEIGYESLNRYANRIAHVLALVSSNAGSIVQVIAPPSIPFIAALLGVFKSGSIFLPVDLAFSEKRLKQVFSETFDGIIIVSAPLQNELTELVKAMDLPLKHLVVLSGDEILLYTWEAGSLVPVTFSETSIFPEDPVLQVNGESSNYIYYTSGSTGEGKAIVGKHAGLSHFIHWEIAEFGIDASFRVSQLVQQTFDASLRDIFTALIAGGTVCIPDPDLKSNPLKLLNWLERSEINLVHCVPSLFRLLTKELQPAADEGCTFNHLKYILLAGELLYARDIQEWRKVAGSHTVLVNLYGPTETTLVKTFYRIGEVAGNPSRIIPVGQPISNTRIAIIKNDVICNAGEIGEIYIKTPFTTKGYYKNEQLTAECFVQNPLVKDSVDIVYKTGDLGRYLPDGNMEVIGRLDSQVKVNGVRVELGEIEQAMLDLEGITGVVVKAHRADDNMTSLIAYYTGEEKDPEVLRGRLILVLNPNVIPSYFIYQQAFPLSMNGKVDRKVLPLPEEIIMGGIFYEPPAGSLENRLAGYWKDILGHRKIGRNISFFSIGGHSLRAIQLVSRIQKELEVDLKIADVFNNTTIRELAAFIAGSVKPGFLQISVAPDQAAYPLSSAQRRLWVLSRLDAESAAYNMWGVHRFNGELEAASLSYALDRMLERHEILRTVFREDAAGNVRQVVLPAAAAGFRLLEYDLRGAHDEQSVQALILEEILRPFDLAQGPLLRAALFRVTDDQWLFAHTLHHIISDAWSMQVLVRELLELYNSHRAGNTVSLPPLRIQYRDYAVWQQEQLSGGLLQQHKSYWLQQFAGELPVLSLPGDYPRPAVKSYAGGAVSRFIEAPVTVRLQELLRPTGSTLFMGLLALVKTLLYRYTGQEDLIIGSSVASREHTNLEDQIGFYVNTLAFRTRFSGTDSYLELLDRVRTVTLEGYAHQQYPFDELVDELDLRRDRSRSVLFDVMVVLQNASGTAERSLGELEVSGYGVEQEISKFDLTFFFTEAADRIRLHLVYNCSIYTKERMELLADHFERLLSAVITHPEVPIASLNYLGTAEQQQLLEVFSMGDQLATDPRSVVELFEAQVMRQPEALALASTGTQYSYGEANARSNRLSHYLRSCNGTGPGRIVAIMMDRSADLIIALLGVLKSGSAYVVIEPEWPVARKKYILEDTAAAVLITESRYLFDVEYYQGTIVALDIELDQLQEGEEDAAEKPAASDLAYVVYTSGTTGSPKGVQIHHHSLTDYVRGLQHRTNLQECRRFGLVSGMSADLGYTVLYGSLLSGGSLHVFNSAEAMDAAVLQAAQLDCIKIVPTHWKALQDNGVLYAPAKSLIFGGEVLGAEVIEALQQGGAGCKVYNHYGPSETTVGKLIKEINLQSKEPITLGRPFCNSRVYILDGRGNLLPVGIPGEICIGGAGVSSGYLNQAALTTEKFIADPWQSGNTLYRTGDAGRWTRNGEIEFLGRKDDQVKIRGYRVELSEIESLLQKHPLIASAAVLLRDTATAEKEVVAYIAAQQESLAGNDLRTYLQEFLPTYMIPAAYVFVDAMPLKGNGKIDRNCLLALKTSAAEIHEAPRTATEAQLLALWQEVLGREGIGIQDNFFDCGGHSLRATRLVSLIHKSFDVQIGLKDVFDSVTIAEQALLIDSSLVEAFQSIPKAADSEEGYPLSSAQRRLWVLSQFEEARIAYNMQSVFEFEGELVLAALEKAFSFMLERHESLRTVFRENTNGEVRQFILPVEASGFRISYSDLRNNPDRERELKEGIKNEFLKPFDLVAGPLIRVQLCRLEDDRWIFNYTMHHIISDGWSKNILINELLSAYNAFSKGTAPDLAPLRIQYRDYAIWEQEQLNGAALQQHKDYWLQQFTGELPVLQLPADRMRPAVKTYNGDVVRKTLNATAVKDLRMLCDKQGATLFMGLFATVNILLHRYTGQEDIILGSLVAGRKHADLEGQIGFYLATLALRTQFSETSTFKEVLDIVKQVTLGAYTHQVYPFEELVDQLHLPRNMSRHPLIDVMVILQNMERTLLPGKQEPGIRINGFAGRENVISKFDLLFDFAETGDVLQLKIEYNRDLYNRDTVQRMLEHLEQMVLAIAARPSLPVNRLDYLGEEEKKQLLSVFNNTELSYPQHCTMIDLFEEQVRRSPTAVALVFEGREVTYGELDRHTSQLADYLLHKGVQADTLVPVCIERGPEMIIAIMGILRAGAAYVPVDTAWPADRIAYVLEDCRATIVIGSSFGKQKMPAAPAIDFIALDSGELMSRQPAEKLRTSPAPHHLAYVIYTSGSTGKPKGVMVEHGGMLNHLLAKINDLQIDSTTILAYTASYTFDISVWQMFAALLCGGRTIIYPDSLIYQPAGLLRSVNADHVTILELVPAYLSMALQETAGLPLKHLQYLLVTGEAVSRSLLEQWFEHPAYGVIPVVNAYGPTEASDDICHHKMYETPAGIHVPLGKPVQNLQIYILNSAQQLCPIGITGEICVAGIGVSRGYLNQEKLTDERFITDPFYNEQQRKMFRTGDLGRWLPDGAIEYLGRMDDQVKIHGYRIEPGEIEGLLQECEGVARAAVSVITDNAGGRRLAAYIVPEGRFNKEGILAWLRNKLPEYMIPSALVEMDRIPLTENGKTDRNALPVPNTPEETAEIYVAPRNETEMQLAAIWQQILGKEKVGIRDNFFDLGGHSLKAIQLMARINAAFLIRINIQTIFKEASIENLAEQILFIQDQNRQKKNREDLVQIEI